MDSLILAENVLARIEKRLKKIENEAAILRKHKEIVERDIAEMKNPIIVGS